MCVIADLILYIYIILNLCGDTERLIFAKYWVRFVGNLMVCTKDSGTSIDD